MNSLYEVARHLTVSNYTTDAMLGAYNKKFWESLPRDIQAILRQASLEAGEWKVELEKRKEAEYIEKMKPKGVTVNYLSPEQHRAFREAMAPVYAKWKKKLGEDWTEAVFQSIEFATK